MHAHAPTRPLRPAAREAVPLRRDRFAVRMVVVVVGARARCTRVAMHPPDKGLTIDFASQSHAMGLDQAI